MSTLLTGLQAYYTLDENTGAIAGDSVGSNNGTISGASWTTGKINNGLSFDGVNDYANYGINPFSGIISDQWTLSAWVYLDGTTGGNQYINSMAYSGSSTASYRTGIALLVTSDNKIYGTFRGASNTNNGADANILTTETISTGQWYFIVYTRDSNNASIYVNGTESVSTTTLDTASVSWSTDRFSEGEHVIGADFNDQYSGNYGGYFQGRIDEVGIRNKPLTASEVTELYNGGAGLQYPFKKSNGNFLLMF